MVGLPEAIRRRTGEAGLYAAAAGAFAGGCAAAFTLVVLAAGLLG